MVWLDNISLRSGSPQTRRKAIEKLAAAGNLPALNRVLSCLADPDPEVRCAAAKALGTSDEHFSPAVRVGALAQVSTQLRIAAATSRPVHDLMDRKPLLRSARDPDPTVRLAAIVALGQDPDPVVTETLLKSRADPDSGVRSAAAQALELHADPAHLNRFLALLADEHFEVRITAIQYLRHTAGQTLSHHEQSYLGDRDARSSQNCSVLSLGRGRTILARGGQTQANFSGQLWFLHADAIEGFAG